MSGYHIQASGAENGDEQEQTLLLETPRRNFRSKSKRRCCIRSKAGLLILCWNLLLSIFLTISKYTSNILIEILPVDRIYTYIPALFGIHALFYLFYPLVGYLADIKYGRYKVAICSLWVTVLGELFISAIFAPFRYDTDALRNVLLFLCLAFFMCALAIIVYSSYGAFNANVIQFGMDQLHDSPAEDSELFIHWFVFTTYAGSIVCLSMIQMGLMFLAAIIIALIVALGTLCIGI